MWKHKIAGKQPKTNVISSYIGCIYGTISLPKVQMLPHDPDGTTSKISMETSDLIFSFVDDPYLLAVLEDYYRQVQKAASADSYLGVIVGCGSVVEA